MLSIETVVREDKNNVKQEVKMIFGTGRLTNDPPQVREVAGGYRVLQGSKDHRFSIAFNVYDKEAGEEKPVFYNLVAWGKMADALSKVGYKGREIEVAGRIEKQSYTNSEGKEVKYDVLVIERFEARGKSKQNQENGTSNSEPQLNESDAQPVEVSEDDIPF